MKLFTALLICVVLSVGIAWKTSAPSWEYKVEYGIKESKINSLASQGWELVTTGTDNAAMTPVPYLIFKRAK